MKLRVLLLSAFFGLGAAVVEATDIAEPIDVAPVWSAHPVGFSLLTHGEKQFVAFYDAERTMTVGVRGLEEEEFTFVQLPRRTGWDSHNYITMAVGNDGFLHLTGDMHGSKLLYFRTERPGDISTFRQIEEMVGRDETRMTYPRFFRGAGNELIFTYRQGGSGNGEQIYNRYEPETRTWKRLLDQPLVSGEGLKNAYLDGPRRGPDGFYHLAWIWRDTPDCETNHHISYARSRDLMKWERGDGKPLELPITFGSGAVVDPVEPEGGAINNNVRLGFDSRHRPIISYHKFDGDGNTQIYNARLEEGEWKIYQTTNWKHRWWFEGRGSIIFKLRVRNVAPVSEGRLRQDFDHWVYGNRRLMLDEETLQPVEEREVPRSRPEELEVVESDFPGMQVRWAGDSGRSPDGSRYLLRWETLPQNRDRARKGDLPEPTMLRLYDLGGD
ncbi:MAG TPA: BNR repeat-containing protein [Opitutales bacterium]|nr:BNR repeat-containing protein [Opitutales bacterium]